MKACPKCHGRMIGPHYEKDGWGERLRFICGCGYSSTEKTADAPEPHPTVSALKRLGGQDDA